ncbi:putative oxidoreductase [Acrocarpospora pleiomorpha]|uniref:Putative oxidoreductase n=1 Tax=Acrocarpospora pleiomorpha TaxID=90975 RepID=A0A5M3Y233_9ACTN|nr:NADH:flavin oxidoreductase [Acrocarpospora pleiomorpha]GES25773.1 putative oxidoreductase [Acrocarpospora pleiomorpha]
MTDPKTHPILEPARLGPISLRNATIKAATFEGMTPGGQVSDRLVEFHSELARGGIGMTTVAYCAVTPDGRLHQNQILMGEEALPGLRRLADAVHGEGAAISAQIGHAGPVSNAKSTGSPALAPSPHLSAQHLVLSRSATSADLRRVAAAHGSAALTAREAGFDAVEVHLGHNYLASSFLSPRLNRRDDEYGGTLANRARVALEALRSVRDAVGGTIAVTAKLNMDDGVARGFWLDEAVQLAQWIERDGLVDALELTAGSSLLNPMYLFRGDAPIQEMAAIMPQPQRTGMRLFGRLRLRSYPFEPLYLLPSARQVRAEVSLPLILLGGVNTIDDMDTAAAQGFQFVAMARALLRDPGLVAALSNADYARGGLCIHCNKCMASIASGARCVLIGPPPEGRAVLGAHAR